MRKVSGSVSIFIPIFVFIATVLVGAILLSPHFGTQLRAPISMVPCEIIHPALHQQKYSSVDKPLPPSVTLHSNHPPVTSQVIEQCYRVEEVLALNKALNMSDTISLLGVLLAVFAFIAPIFSYLTLKKDRQDLEKLIKKSTKKSVENSINQPLQIIQSVEEFKSAYQTDVYLRVSCSTTEPHEISIHNMHRFATEAHKIASQLLSLLNRKVKANDAFNNIACYIKNPAVADNEPHIIMLKKTIRQLHDACYLGSDERKAALSDFLKETLKISHEDFINCTPSENT